MAQTPSRAGGPAATAPAHEPPGPAGQRGWAEATESRLTALEEKACYSDDLLEHLNRQVAEQQAQIELLLRELLRLRQLTAAAQPEGFRSLRDDLPPHY